MGIGFCYLEFSILTKPSPLDFDYFSVVHQQCREGQDVLPEQIKAVLLDSAGFHGML